MIANNFRLLIHHHAPAYLDASGEIWMGAYIGSWVNAIAAHFERVGVLASVTPTQTTRQDTRLHNTNTKLYSLGSPGHYWDRIQRMHHLRKICQAAAVEMDGLLIRGITPRQYSVWKYSDLPYTALLLVGSIGPSYTRLHCSWLGVFRAILARLRVRELKRMLRANVVPLVNSPALQEELREQVNVEAHFTPTNTLSDSDVAPLEVRELHQPRRLLYCGRLDFRKGLRELLQAVAQLEASEISCELNVVARKKEPEFSALRALAIELGIENRVHWKGRIPFGPQLFAQYQDADIFILPSYSEGFPHVLWEAAANSCPVIATAVGGIPELWEEDRHGLLIPPRDVAAIVRAVRRLLTNQALRRRLITRAYAHSKKYTVEASTEKMIDILEQLWE